MLQAFQSVKVTKKGKDQGRVGRVTADDGETVMVQLDGDAEPVAFKPGDLEAI